MKRWTGAKIGVIVIALLTLLYVVMILQIAVALITSGEAIAIVMGLALVIFPIVGAVFIARELVFGMQSEQLLRKLADAGELPEDSLPKRPSGRPVREAADADFVIWAQAVEANPDSAANWARLSLAYDASGDRRRARGAMRRAIRLAHGRGDPESRTAIHSSDER